MSLPTLRVAIGVGPASDRFVLDDSTLDSSDTLADNSINVDWTDITEFVRAQSGVNINRGGTLNSGPVFRAEAGTCSFTLDNRTGVFDPFNTGVSTVVGTLYGSGTYGGSTYGSTTYTTGSPYTIGGDSVLKPGLPVSVQATLDGRTYDLFTGFVTTWLVEYPEAGVDSVARVTATDAIGRLSRSNLPELLDYVGDDETVGERLERVMDRHGWYTACRDISQANTEPLLSTLHDGPAWDEMQSAVEAVNGYLWVKPDSTVTYRSKSQFPREASWTFGPSNAQVPTRTVQVSNDYKQLFNSIKLSREDGGTQAVTDQDSIDDYGVFSYEASGLPLADDLAVTDSLTYLLSQCKDLRLRVEGFTATLHTGSGQAWHYMLDLDVLDRVAGTFTTPDLRVISREGLVRGLELSIGPTVWEWKVSTAQAPEALGTFTLDDTTLGLLGTGTLAAF